jgi:hypothetical protein
LPEASPVLRILLRRSLAGEDISSTVVHFEAAVLDRYRESAGYSLIRTNTVGRVKREGGWSLDLGIAAEGALVHAFAGDLLRLPPEERDHFALHAVSLPTSENFLQMRMAPSACHDDGEVRKWE